MLLGVLGAVLLIVVGVVLGVVLLGGSNDSSSNASTSTLPGAADVQQLLDGIPQHDNVLGRPSAPVTMVEWIDLQCPYCQQFETQAMPQLILAVRPQRQAQGRDEPHRVPRPRLAARPRSRALAAGKQNKLFNLMQLLYDNQGAENTGWLNDDILKSAAASVPGLDAERVMTDRNSTEITNRANAFDSQAQADGVRSTPTILVGKSGETPKLVARRATRRRSPRRSTTR